MRNIGNRGVVRKWKIYISILLFCVILGTSIYHSVDISSAATVTVGTVSTGSNNLNVRSGAGTNYGIIGSLAKGAQVTILGEENGWYKIQYGSGAGYVSKDYINNVHTVEMDTSYVDELVAKGFPYSYATSLASLHVQYPNWVFEPVNTGLDWNTVIEKESVLGINLVPATSNDSWKTTATASNAYNWATNTWKILDGSSWVGASPEIVAYYMDPRNFLDDTNIFQFETLRYASYQNKDDVSKVLAGTFMSGALRGDSSKTYAEVFMAAGSNVNVNPAHLATRCKQEQGAQGTSPLISGTYAGYAGYYNYFNIGAYGTPKETLYKNGLQKAKNEGWTSVELSITGGAKFLADKYISLGQDTLYFQKFNVVNKKSGLYTYEYMTNVQAAYSEGKTMGSAYSNKNQAYVFRIPVYNNMPETVCPMPNSGNPNNWLKSLTVSGGNLTPSFNGATTEYSMIVSQNTSSINVGAAAVAATSSVSGTGAINLNYGSNLVQVTCKAQNGSTRVYTINVVRQGSAAAAKGDVDGDGTISLMDMVIVKRHILNIETLTGGQFTAADIDGNGTVDLMDCLMIKRHILGYEKIS